MIIKVQRYLGDCRWGKVFDYSFDENNLDQMNNDGLGSYRLYRKRGRPTTIFYHQEERDWINYSGFWNKGCLFFATEKDREKVWDFSQKEKIITLQQPHEKVCWETYDPMTG